MAGKPEYIFAMQNMFTSDGWRRFYIPELQEMRRTLTELLIYDDTDEATMKGRTNCIRLLDEILTVEERVNKEAIDLKENPQEAANPMVQSPQDAVN